MSTLGATPESGFGPDKRPLRMLQPTTPARPVTPSATVFALRPSPSRAAFQVRTSPTVSRRASSWPMTVARLANAVTHFRRVPGDTAASVAHAASKSANGRGCVRDAEVTLDGSSGNAGPLSGVQSPSMRRSMVRARRARALTHRSAKRRTVSASAAIPRNRRKSSASRSTLAGGSKKYSSDPSSTG